MQAPWDTLPVFWSFYQVWSQYSLVGNLNDVTLADEDKYLKVMLISILNGVGLKVFDDIFVACMCDSRKDSVTKGDAVWKS